MTHKLSVQDGWNLAWVRKMDRVFGRETVGKLYSTLRRLRNFEVLLDVKGGQR